MRLKKCFAKACDVDVMSFEEFIKFENIFGDAVCIPVENVEFEFIVRVCDNI